MVEQRLPAVNGDDGAWGDILNQFLEKEHYNTGLDNVANGGHKNITIQPGTTVAGTAPLKFTSGPLLITPEIGAVEFLDDRIYFTQTTDATRKTIAVYDDASGAQGDIYYRDVNANFVQLPIGDTSTVLKVVDGAPAWGVLPAGDTGEVQFNNAGELSASPNFGYDVVNSRVTIGESPSVLPDNPLAMSGDVGAYLQVNLQNNNKGEEASADFVITADNGNDTQNYFDLGLNGSGYANPDWDFVGPNSGYLMVDGGDIGIGSLTPAKTVKFFIANTIHEAHPEDVIAEISSTGLDLSAGSSYSINGEDIRQAEFDRSSAGLVSGGGLTAGSPNTTLTVAAGSGWAWDGTQFVKVTWTEFTNQTVLPSQYNYVAIDHLGALNLSVTETTGSGYIRLGHFIINASGILMSFWETPDWVGDYQHRNNEFVGEIFGTIIGTGFIVSEQSNPNELKLSVSAGNLYAKLSKFTYGVKTTFLKLMYCTDQGLAVDFMNNDSIINTTLWNDFSKDYATSLTTMTTNYWAKAMVGTSVAGIIYYIYPGAEYATEDEAKSAPLPLLDALRSDGNAALATIVFQKGDTSIASKITDMRPIMGRAFGLEATSSGSSSDHGFLTGLGDDDHSQYHNDARANTWLSGKTLDNIADGTTNKGYTDTEKTKLSGIATGAEANVNADWNSSSGDSQILNKPSIPNLTDIDLLTFKTSPTLPAEAVGQTYYDAANRTLATRLGDGVTLQHGQESHVNCHNDTGSTILNGRIVYITGSNGTNPTIALANAISDELSDGMVVGITTQDITDGNDGKVTNFGIVHDMNTSAWTAGTVVYLSDSVAGTLVDTPPTSPSVTIKMGIVTIQHATAGSVLVDISFSGNLNDLIDVTIDAPLTDQVLKYNGTNWVNGQQVASSAGAGVNYFYDMSASDIGTYYTLQKSPADEAEDDNSVVANNDRTLIEVFASGSAGLDGTQIDAGVWNFNTWAYVNDVSSGNSSIDFDVYKRTSGGVETLLFNVNTGTISSTVASYQTASAQQSFEVNPTDRLVIKVYGLTTATSNRTIHFVHAGTTHYSYINTPLVTRHNDLAGLQGGTNNQYYHLTSAQYTVVGNTSGSNTGDQTKVDNLIGGNSTTLLGSIPYQSNTDTTTLLAPNTSTTKQVLSQTGTGSNGAIPTWTTIFSGLNTISVGTSAPSSPNNGDLWIDTN